MDEKTNEDSNFWYSVQTFINIMCTEICPFYFAIDKKIVKIFTLNFLEARSEDNNSNGSQEGVQSLNNSVNLDLADNFGTGRSTEIDLSDDDADSLLSSPGSADGTKRRPSIARTLSIALTSNGSTIFSDTAVQQERQKLEEKLNLKESQFVKGDPFTKPWYPFERKFLKQKLGSLYHCTIKEEDDGLCRVMNYDRISSYQIEAFFTELARIQLYKM